MTTKATAMEAVGLAERLKLEAQIHAGEARGANAAIAEIYQLCTGATGEPGNWHGAEPVRKLIAEHAASLAAKEAEVVVLRAALTDARWAVAAFVREIKPEHATNPLPDSVLARIDAALTQGTP
jgi:hypothetical protein